MVRPLLYKEHCEFMDALTQAQKLTFITAMWNRQSGNDQVLLTGAEMMLRDVGTAEGHMEGHTANGGL